MPWGKVPLGQVVSIVSGATPKTGAPEYWDGDINWATPADLSGLGGAYIANTPRKITKVGLASCSAKILPPNSVLFSSRAPIGHVAINTKPMATNQGFKSLVPKAGVVDAKYLYHWLCASRDFLQSLGNGATFKEVSKAVVERIEIPLPPLEEQRRIADILDRADALRAKRRQTLTLLDDLTQSIFLDMFGDPKSNPHDLPKVRLDSLVAVGDRINYGVLQPGDNVDGGVGLVRVANLSSGRIDRAELKQIDPAIESSYLRSRVRGNEVLVSCVGSIGRIAVATHADVGLNVARAVSRVPITSPSVRTYVAAHLRTQAVQRYFVNELRTVAQPTLNVKQLAATSIMLPPVARIDRFVAALSRLDQNRALSQQASNNLRQFFASLQQRAFAGEL